VVIAIIAILAAMLLPALGRAKFRAQLTHCASNFKQWGVSVNMYASDFKDSLPSWDCPTGGSWMWDQGTSFIPVMKNYGMTFAMYFCPVRPSEVNRYRVPGQGTPPRTIDELYSAMTAQYNETILVHSWWVPRLGSAGMFPRRQSGVLYNNTSDTGYDWPKKTTDRAITKVPFISDAAYSGSGGIASSSFNTTRSTRVEDIRRDSAHFYAGVLNSVNIGCADGHVETRNRNQIKAMQPSASPVDPIWFY